MPASSIDLWSKSYRDDETRHHRPLCLFLGSWLRLWGIACAASAGEGTMKALSVQHPWASLIIQGLKDVENRSWPTKFRGRIYLHASLRYDWEGLGKIEGILDDEYPESIAYHNLLYGGLIGEVDLVDCVRDSSSPWAEPGMWHWVLANPVVFSTPIPYKGRLGLFEVVKP